jgi:hypothetical protein
MRILRLSRVIKILRALKFREIIDEIIDNMDVNQNYITAI